MSKQSTLWHGIGQGVLLCVVAMGIRLLGYHEAIGDDVLWTFSDDPPYHLRRILLTLSTWPAVPTQDAFVNFPHAVTLYWPPGLPWMVAGLVKFFRFTGFSDPVLVEWIAALFPPLVGTGTVLLLYVGLRYFFSSWLSFWMALWFSCVPAHVQYTKFARFDHHIFEPLLTVLLFVALLGAIHAAKTYARVLWALLGALTITSAFLVWPGVLLHLGFVVLAVLVAVVVLARWCDVSSAGRVAQAGSWIFGLAILTSFPALLWSPWTTVPVFFAFSPFHLAMMAVAAAALAWLGYVWTRRSSANLFLHLGLSCGIPGSLVLLLPSIRRALGDGVSYTKGSAFTAMATEATGFLQHPENFLLVASWPTLLATGMVIVGAVWFAWRKDTRPADVSSSCIHRISLVVVLCASVVLVIPALVSRRWLTAWSPFGFFALAVCWQYILQPLGRQWMFGREHRWQLWVWIAWCGLFLPSVLHCLKLRPVAAEEIKAQQFYQVVRSLTPEIAGEFVPGTKPPYGILTSWSIGHIVSYRAGRPTLANNFFGMPWHDQPNRLALRWLLEDRCDDVAQKMQGMRLNYLITTSLSTEGFAQFAKVAGRDEQEFMDAQKRPQLGVFRSLLYRLGAQEGQPLHLRNEQGQRQNLPACTKFRLLTEAHIYPSPKQSPGQLKLYERVQGAALLIRASAGATVDISIPLQTQQGRQFRWSAQGVVPASGQFVQRVPYPTEMPCRILQTHCRVFALAPYQIQINKLFSGQVAVSHQAVQHGLSVVVPEKP